MEYKIKLPVPPSVNQLWRMGKGNWYTTPKYRAYLEEVKILVAMAKIKPFDDKARLSLIVEYYQHDNRRRDLDNLLKALGDSLQGAYVYDDDSQIDLIMIRRYRSDTDYIFVTISDNIV